MNYLKKGFFLILLTISVLTSITTYSNTKPHSNESNPDYSTNLKTFLEHKSNELNGKSFLFNIKKQRDTYKVQVRHNNKTEIKIIPKATVDDFFQNNINSSGQDILNIINIGGKK